MAYSRMLKTTINPLPRISSYNAKKGRLIRSNSKSSMMVSECLVVPSRLRDSETPISKLAK